MADLELLLMVGDDRSTVHLRAGARHRQHTAHGNDLAVGFLKADIVFIPGIVVTVDGYGYRLRVVTARPAADRKEEIDLVLARQPHALAQLIDRRVGHDARVLDDGLSVRLEDRDDLVVESVFLDRTAAVDQLDGLAVFGQLFVEIAQRVIAEIKLGGIVITEIA